MLILILPTERIESCVNFIGKEGHPNIQPSTRPGIEPGTSGLGGRNLNHCTNSSGVAVAIIIIVTDVAAAIVDTVVVVVVVAAAADINVIILVVVTPRS